VWRVCENERMYKYEYTCMHVYYFPWHMYIVRVCWGKVKDSKKVWKKKSTRFKKEESEKKSLRREIFFSPFIRLGKPMPKRKRITNNRWRAERRN
jgi:hypothetical protein